MKALYRKYRPLELGQVVGQKQVTDALAKALETGKISHAYLFIGPRGTGKTSVARIFAHGVNGFPYALEDDYVDIIEIDGASNRGIDNIRELREKVMISPSQGKYKVYIIDEVHMLTKEAFNALLKTLEEPPSHVIFIMATTDAYRVPVTITSRSQVFTFTLADAETMLQHLRVICEQEKIAIDDEALRIIVKRGGGSYRDSLSLLDQISTLSEEEITAEMVTAAMGLPEDEKIQLLLDKYSQGSASEITEILKKLLESGIKAEAVAGELINVIIETPRPELIPLLKNLTGIREPFAVAKLLVALIETRMQTNIAGQPLAPISRSAQKPESEAEKTQRPSMNRPSKVNTKAADSLQSGAEVARDLPRPSAGAVGNFNWDELLEAVRSQNEVIYQQLLRSEHEIIGSEVKIYPKTKIVKNILEKERNKRILCGAARDVKITITEAGEHPSSGEENPALAKISAIMGGKVEVINGGGNPFEG